MRLFLYVFIFFFVQPHVAIGQEHVEVKGYTRSNGTYVKPHYRTKPDSTVNNNWSTKGNINPYTGKEGWLPRENYQPRFQGADEISTVRANLYPTRASVEEHAQEPSHNSANSYHTEQALGVIFFTILILFFLGIPFSKGLRTLRKLREDENYVKYHAMKLKADIRHEFSNILIGLAVATLFFSLVATLHFLSK